MTAKTQDQPDKGMGSETFLALRDALLALNSVGRALTEAIRDAVGPGLTGNSDITLLVQLRSGPLRPFEIVTATGLSNSGVSTLLGRLEGRGFIERTNSDDDARAVTVDLTGHGRAHVDAVFEAVNARFDSLRPRRRDILRLLDAPVRRMRAVSPHSKRPSGRMAHLGAELTEAFRLAEYADDPNPAGTAVVLAAASRVGGARHRDLRDAIDLSAGGVTQLIERLNAVGLLTRTTGQPPDRRATIVTLTADGESALHHCLRQLAEHRDEIATALT
jgi:DNA-binding MarR family transcriptional regulator